jgi:hypothetical protein
MNNGGEQLAKRETTNSSKNHLRVAFPHKLHLTTEVSANCKFVTTGLRFMDSFQSYVSVFINRLLTKFDFSKTLSKCLNVDTFVIFHTYLLTHTVQQSPSWEANWFCSQSRNSPHFMEPDSSLPHSQVPATCPYPEPTPSSPHNPLPLPEDPS